MFTWRRVSGFVMLVAAGLIDDARHLWRERGR